jgi:hypothetical protein
MTKDEKRELIEQFEKLSGAFDDVQELSTDLILYRPFEGSWSIVEQIVHCLDVDIANFHRYRWGITNPGTQVLSFNQVWTEKLNYQASDIRMCLNLIKLIRKFMAAHLRTLIDKDWNDYNYIFGDERKLNLEEALQLYIDHVGFHRELI